MYKQRYFTIWAPRQTGKSTYFSFLAEHLTQEGYNVCHVSMENFMDAAIEDFPYQIALLVTETHRFSCGGSILNPTTVLTAVHCT